MDAATRADKPPLNALAPINGPSDALIAKEEALLASPAVAPGPVDEVTPVIPVPQGRVRVGVPAFSVRKAPRKGRDGRAEVAPRRAPKPTDRPVCKALPEEGAKETAEDITGLRPRRPRAPPCIASKALGVRLPRPPTQAPGVRVSGAARPAVVPAVKAKRLAYPLSFADVGALGPLPRLQVMPVVRKKCPRAFPPRALDAKAAGGDVKVPGRKDVPFQVRRDRQGDRTHVSLLPRVGVEGP